MAGMLASARHQGMDEVASTLPENLMKGVTSYTNSFDLISQDHDKEKVAQERLKFIERGLKREAEEADLERRIEEERIARENDPEWLATVKGQAHTIRKQIEADNGYHEFESLFDKDGKKINAKKVTTKFGKAWAIFAEDDTHQRTIISWFSPSKAKNLATAVVKNREKGFYVGKTKEKAKLRIHEEYNRYSGARFQEVIVYRDRDNAEDVIVIDNGQD